MQKSTPCAFDHAAYAGAGFLPTLAFYFHKFFLVLPPLKFGAHFTRRWLTLTAEQIIFLSISSGGTRQKDDKPILQQKMVSQERVFAHLFSQLVFQRVIIEQNCELTENNSCVSLSFLQHLNKLELSRYSIRTEGHGKNWEVNSAQQWVWQNTGWNKSRFIVLITQNTVYFHIIVYQLLYYYLYE